MIGAGAGGLAASIELAAAGVRVTVVEAMERPGGKMGIAEAEGVEFDTGPSVLTLPGVLDSVLRRAGSSLEEELVLRAPAPSFRYLYPDGALVDVYAEPERTLVSVEQSLGPAAAAELGDFLRYAAGIWEAAAPAFVFGPAPSPRSLLAGGLASLAALWRIDPGRRMWSAIRARVRSEHLRLLLARYATYNGSDPRRAPATLNCISHVELTMGGFGVEGGMYQVARVLTRAAERLGVRFRLGRRASAIRTGARGVEGVELADGTVLPASSVIGNADAALVLGRLLPPDRRPRGGGRPAEPSMSGWVGVARARRPRAPESRVAHTVLFPERYMEEFADIFDRGRAPTEPTVYLCAQEACHGRTGWAEHEPLFLMANAPPVRDPAAAEAGSRALRDRVLARARGAGLLGEDDRLVYQRGAEQLARQFPGSAGSIYGAASNSPLAAFGRPANRVRGVPGLYLASGSAHPGGGVPLCLLSGRAAAAALIDDHKL